MSSYLDLKDILFISEVGQGADRNVDAAWYCTVCSFRTVDHIRMLLHLQAHHYISESLGINLMTAVLGNWDHPPRVVEVIEEYHTFHLGARTVVTRRHDEFCRCRNPAGNCFIIYNMSTHLRMILVLNPWDDLLYDLFGAIGRPHENPMDTRMVGLSLKIKYPSFTSISSESSDSNNQVYSNNQAPAGGQGSSGSAGPSTSGNVSEGGLEYKVKNESQEESSTDSDEEAESFRCDCACSASYVPYQLRMQKKAVEKRILSLFKADAKVFMVRCSSPQYVPTDDEEICNEPKPGCSKDESNEPKPGCSKDGNDESKQ